MTTHLDRTRGCLFGLAYGDALAARAEFLSVAEILAKWPPSGPRDLEGNPALVTDDTQMAVAVAEALADSLHGETVTVASVQRSIGNKFAEWFHSSDNTRSPGLTCLSAAARLSQGHRWTQATIPQSKGCGANMRVAPVGLLRLRSDAKTDDGADLTVSTLAQTQAAMTHGHPTALAASDLTARAVAMLVAGAQPDSLVDALLEYCDLQRTTYYDQWLGELWELQTGADGPLPYIAVGWAECIRALQRLERALASGDEKSDPCDLTGSAWIAEEALATALLCFLQSPDDPLRVLNRAAVTRGDSDSIAAIAGSFVGARLGFGAWPAEWEERIEGSQQLATVAQRIAEVDR